MEDEAGLDEHDALTDEAVETVEALEALRKHLMVSLESGGLDLAGAGVLDISLKHMYRRLGVRTVRVTLALESFGSIARRSETTKIAMEEMGEQVKRSGKLSSRQSGRQRALSRSSSITSRRW